MNKISYLCFMFIALQACSKKNMLEPAIDINSRLQEVVSAPFFSIGDENQNVRISWSTKLSSDSISKYLIKVGVDDTIFQTNTATKELLLKRKTSYYNQAFVLQAMTKSGKTIQIDTLKYENDYSRFFTCKNKYIAHRGLSNLYPENTAIAFEKAADKGFEYVECDIWLTKDKKWVVIHDETINRTSNGVGGVAQFTYDELKNYDFGFPTKFKANYSQKILSLEEFVSLCEAKNIKPLIEIKEKNISEDALSNMLDIINSTLTYDKYLIHCTRIPVLFSIRELDKKSILGIVATNYNVVELPILSNLYPCLYNVGSSQLALNQPFNSYSNSNIYNIISNGFFVSVWVLSDLSQIQNLSNNNLFTLTGVIPTALKK